MMEALSKCIASQGHKIASAALGTSSRYHQRQLSSTAWPEATPSPRINRRTELDYEELSALLLMEDVSLIDVRHPNELQAYGEIPGSVHIPLNDLKTALQMPEETWICQFNLSKPSKQDRNLVFYSRGPNTSRAAVEIAHRLGYKGSRQYTGGWEDYCNQTGIPLKKNIAPKCNAESTSPYPSYLDSNLGTTHETNSPYIYGSYDYYM